MIGVFCHEEEREWAVEFFELFKTPWEFLRKGESYSVVLSTQDCPPETGARLVLLYGSKTFTFDEENHLSAELHRKGSMLYCRDVQLPVYGNVITFAPDTGALLKPSSSERAAAISLKAHSRTVSRIGYDLFQELRHLLTFGQPAEFAAIPTIDLHIVLLRSWILEAEIPLVEIPPCPAGVDFLVCLTHDVDFAGIRMHKFDHTLGGFLYRALLGSAVDLFRKRAAWKKLVRNWMAALSLPAVYAGLAKDFWIQFEQYLELERDLKSTFYFIPYRRRAGAARDGNAPARRACKYDISDVRAWAERISSRGCEIGLHGIDAWKEASSGKDELERISKVAGVKAEGVRMHWLYFGARSPGYLEEAGFSYDSTLGYNDAVGFRAGTGQVFRPSGAKNLLEIPLIIQDTALFYRGRMDLRENEAMDLCRDILERFRSLGGALVVNWHHRSLAPERLWGEFYRTLLREIGKHRVRFLTAGEAVDWFRLRRSAFFERADRRGTKVRVRFRHNGDLVHSGLVVRVYRPGAARTGVLGLCRKTEKYADLHLQENDFVEAGGSI